MTTTTHTADPFASTEIELAQKHNASPVVAALEAAWMQIRADNPDVPEAIIIVGSASDRYGHFAHGRWATPDGQKAEVFVSGEGLSRGAEAVMTTLLHEAVHGIASARGIKDTSRYGRYHNERFAKLARDMGMDVEANGPHGMSTTIMSPGMIEDYAPEIARIAEALAGLSRNHETKRPTNGRTSNNNGVVATCECDIPRRIRIAQSVLDLGPIECHICNAAFEIRD